jgi:signal transduction histidine kinase
MARPFAKYLAQLDFIYRDRAYFAGVKARLLAGFLVFLLLFLPLNIAKLIWLQAPALHLRIVGHLGMMLCCLFALRLIFKGAIELAGNGLPLAMVLLTHLMIFAAPTFSEPLAFGIQVFAYDVTFLVVAMAFASRRVAVAVMASIIVGHLALYHVALSRSPLGGSLEFAARALLRDGLISLCIFFVLGISLLHLMERTHHRSEQALRETRALNANLERLVAERTRELVALNEEKNVFMGMAAHDLRNPALKIRIISEMIETEGDYSPPRVRADLATIGATATRMLGLLTDLLDVNAIEQGRQTLSPVPLDAHALLREVHADFRGRASAKGLELVLLPPPPDAPAVLPVLVDAVAIRQVLDNLVSNALKFSPAGKRVWLSAEPAPGGGVRFAVRDEGPGLKDADRGKLFGKFSRLSAQPTAGETSNGLGLSIVKRLVDSMGGAIAVDSVQGHGATFRADFPAA